MVYALIALGFHLIYKGTGVINFAQGEFALFGSMLMWFFWVKLGLNGFLSFMLTVSGTTLTAIIVERAVFAPLRHQPHLTLVMVLLGVATLYTQGMLFAFGHDPLTVPLFTGKTLIILDAALSPQTLGLRVFLLSHFPWFRYSLPRQCGPLHGATMINEEELKSSELMLIWYLLRIRPERSAFRSSRRLGSPDDRGLL
jgi:hypothetical protein